MERFAVAIFVLVNVLAHGLLWFPLGIFGIFVWDLQLMIDYGGIFCYVGWSVYLVLIAAGLQYPRRAIFFVLVLLLVMNIVGFQAGHVRHVVWANLMW